MTLSELNDQKSFLIGVSFKTARQQKEFTVLDVSSRGLRVRPQSSLKDRLISALEVETMGEQWEGYKAGRVSRSELANGEPKIFNTSYIESIFYAVESRQ